MAKREDEKPEGVEVTVRWGDATNLEPVPVDEVHFQDLGDRVYFTFGQVRFPLDLNSLERGSSIEIRPVVRILMTRAAATKLVTLLETSPLSQKKGEQK
jgi:hypothetical protein